MTVQELRLMLSTLPGDRQIVLSSDEEGNSFGSAQGFSPDEVFDDSHDLHGVKTGVPCVVLFP